MSSVPPPSTSPLPPAVVGTPGTPPPSTPPTPRKGLSRPVLIEIAAVVIIIVVVLALLLAGIIPGLHTGSSSGGTASGTATEQSAESAAATYAAGVSGGPWSLYIADGVDTTVGSNTSVSSSGLGNASCPLTGSKVTNLVLPGYNGTYSDGLAEAWLMGFLSSTGTGAGLFLFVQNGAAADLGEITAPGCVKNSGASPLPGGLIDSTTAASDAVATSNGSKYVSAIAHSNATYELANAFGSSAIPVWEIFFYACFGGNETSFAAGVYATNGTIVSTDYESSPSSQCGTESTPPLGTNFSWGIPVNATGTIIENACTMTTGHYCYSIEIAGAGGGITTSNIALSLRSATGATIAWPAGVSVYLLTPTTATYQSSYSTTSSSWTPVTGFSGTLASGDNIVIYTASTGASQGLLGDSLVAIGVNGYSGTVSSNAFS
jgi:hypothetical protein